MSETKWEEHALLVLKFIEDTEECQKAFENRISNLERTNAILSFLVKALGLIMVPLVIDAIRTFFQGG